jgi:hypothetical protein
VPNNEDFYKRKDLILERLESSIIEDDDDKSVINDTEDIGNMENDALMIDDQNEIPS